ncbi:hypothetical protein [Nannocystis pusilla]|uniref:hypothetical protein n=1 Tax=Nannocystis pusilla TaxID=889268 RepID=UPI003B80D0B5
MQQRRQLAGLARRRFARELPVVLVGAVAPSPVVTSEVVPDELVVVDMVVVLVVKPVVVLVALSLSTSTTCGAQASAADSHGPSAIIRDVTDRTCPEEHTPKSMRRGRPASPPSLGSAARSDDMSIRTCS